MSTFDPDQDPPFTALDETTHPGHSICAALRPGAADEGINSGGAPGLVQQNYFYDSQLNAGGRPLFNVSSTGGGSGALISPAPGLGMSSYQLDPTTADGGPQ